MRIFADIEVKTVGRQNLIVAEGQGVTRVNRRGKGGWREEKYAFCELGIGMAQSLPREVGQSKNPCEVG
jgi:hypothetical protein